VVVLRAIGARVLAVVAIAWLLTRRSPKPVPPRGVPTDASYTGREDWQLEVER
jgi:hypothetical protein